MSITGRYPWMPGYSADDLGAVVTVNGATGTVVLDAADVGAVENLMTTAGDLTISGAAGVSVRLPIGTEGQVLKIVSGAVAWATP